MKTLLVDALPTDAPADQARARALLDALRTRGHEVTQHRLREERFGPCQGCFRCWIAQPGTCKQRDASNALMRDIVASELLVWVTKPRFGAWDPVAKAALDKTIGLVSPFFTTVEGETHHEPRYRRYPRLLVLAEIPASVTADEREAFRTLIARNAVNMHNSVHAVVFVEERAGDEDAARWRDALARGLAEVSDGDRESAASFPHIEPKMPPGPS